MRYSPPRPSIVANGSVLGYSRKSHQSSEQPGCGMDTAAGARGSWRSPPMFHPGMWPTTPCPLAPPSIASKTAVRRPRPPRRGGTGPSVGASSQSEAAESSPLAKADGALS